MFNWFKKKVINWVKEDWNKASIENKYETSQAIPSTISKGRRLEQNGMNFTIYSANGGYVMEYSTYDHKTDRRDTALHIIPTDQDLGQGIAHVITFEMLRK
jgi:hypothetical protein